MKLKLIINELSNFVWVLNGKHGDDKTDYDYPTGGSDAFKRGCFFLSSFHDEKFNCWYLNRVLKIKHRDTTSRLRTDRA